MELTAKQIEVEFMKFDQYWSDNFVSHSTNELEKSLRWLGWLACASSRAAELEDLRETANRAINDALKFNAAEPQPVAIAQNERASFEACHELRHCDFERNKDLVYTFSTTRCAWLAWQARAAQTAQPVAVPEEVTNALATYNADSTNPKAHAFVCIVEDWLEILAAPEGKKP